MNRERIGLKPFLFQALAGLIICAVACLVYFAQPILPAQSAEPAYAGCGLASWYGPGFHGKLTANGERYNMNGMTAAHKSLPFGTVLHLVNPKTGQTASVRVNDRGPFIKGRVLDLSRGAALKLGVVQPGVAKLCWGRRSSA